MNKFVRKVNQFGAVVALTTIGALVSCSNEDPVKQNVPEFISSVKLIFTPVGGGTAVTASATDPDGTGAGSIVVSGPINLTKNITYTLTFEILNNLAAVTDPAYNVTAAIEEESNEHQFFFSWSNNVFSNPTGNGNIDNKSDPLNYNDEDVNGLSVGLSTSWTSLDIASTGTFRILLKHQPDLKSVSSTSSDGESDIDLTFDLTVE